MIAFFRNFFFRDFWLKLLSFILAVLIWKIVSLATGNDIPPNAGLLTDQTFTSVPVRVVTTAGDERSFAVEPAEVDVTLQGERKALQNLQINDIRALVDLTGIESAHGLRKRIEVSPPAGTTVLRTIPDEVNATVSPKK